MRGEWREVAVEEIKAQSENALATGPFGSSIGSRFFEDSGVPVIRGSNLSEDIGTRLNDQGLVFLSPDKAREFSRSTVRDGDLVFTCWGTVNQVGLIDRRAAHREYIISNKQMKLTPNPAKTDSLFLYYLFSSPELQHRIKNQSIGSSVPGFNLGQLRALRIRVPEVVEQRALAHILGTLDDKIELNRRMNETLEAMARALFKSWFVDFDPVRAKAEGSDPALPRSVADLFPERFEDSELCEIPAGWKVRSLDEIARFLNGLALQKYPPKDGRALPVIKIVQLRGGSTEGADLASADLDPDYIVEDGDVLFSWSGSLECVLWAGGRGALNQHLFKVTSVRYPKWLYYLGIH
jgi:type I restriction enzyme S subunit